MVQTPMKANLFCLIALVVGIAVLLLSGGEPPAWLLKLEVLVLSPAALAFGYTTFAPTAPSWVWSQPVRGVICIYLGVGAMFVPPQFLVSACFLGIGTRLVMAGLPPRVTATVKSTAIRSQAGAIVPRGSGHLASRD
jgi:hypothetical protein